MMLVHEGLPERGKCCTVTYDVIHDGWPEGRCCTVTYDAVHEGLPERGNVAQQHMMLFMRDCQRGKCSTVTYDAVHEGLPEGEMLHGNI